MRGHVRKRGEGSWCIVYDEGHDEQGKRKQRWRGGFKTRREAEDALAKVLDTIATGVYLEPTKMTYRQYVETTWLPVVRETRRPTTVEQYERTLRKHVLPSIGSAPLQKLTAPQLDRLYRSLTDKLSPSSVRVTAAIVSASLRYAHRKRLVPVNVATLADVPTARRKRMRAWTPEQVGAFVEHTKGERLAALWRFLAMTGARRGEALALTWYAVDLDVGTSRIERQLVPLAGSLLFAEPNTAAGVRTIRLDPATVDALRAHRAFQDVEKAEWGDAYQDGGLVFCRPDGSPLDPRSVSQAFQVRRKAAGLPASTLHGLRHAAATTLTLRFGAHPETTRAVLGHASTATTAAYYTHAVDGLSAAAVASLADLVHGAR
jgi:integrase